MKPLYTASAASTGDGRNGHVETSDGILVADVRTPTEMGGPGGATNPEQLFAAGYSACFHSALRQVAKKEGADATDSEVVADVVLGDDGEGGFQLAVTLEVNLPRVSAEQAQALAEKAHQVCPYSKATRGNVEVALKVA